MDHRQTFQSGQKTEKDMVKTLSEKDCRAVRKYNEQKLGDGLPSAFKSISVTTQRVGKELCFPNKDSYGRIHSPHDTGVK